MISSRRILALSNAWLVPAVLAIYVVAYMVDEYGYRYSLREDKITEWLTFVFLIVAGVLSLGIARRLWGRRDRRLWFFVVFGVGSLLAGFEEISWAQRVFGLESPEFFKEASTTREISAHNVIQDQFNVLTKHIAGIVLFFYGVLLPILARLGGLGRLLDRIGFVVPPASLIAAWLIGAILMFDRPTGEEEEIGELVFAICFTLFMLGEWVRVQHASAGESPDDQLV